jgi:hypothetical protein
MGWGTTIIKEIEAIDAGQHFTVNRTGLWNKKLLDLACHR